jgi:YidC/Oxa1 family membrane protein insertase
MTSVLDGLFDFLAALLNFFYGLWPTNINYGMAIVMLTLVVLLVSAPLTFKQTKSMIAMQRLQPEVKALQAQHRDDRERLNQEMMALYQSHGVNPLGGCLPMLVQLPLFLVLFNVIRGITRRLTETGLGIGSAGFARGFESVALTEGRPTGFSAIPVNDFASRNFNPAYLDHSDEMYRDLIANNEMVSFGFDLSRSARQVVGDGIATSWPYFALIVFVFITSMVQQRQIRGRRDASTAVNSQQEMIMKILPFMLPVFSFTFAAAVTLYFVVSNLFRVGQQSLITRQFYSDEAKAASEAKVAEIKAKRTSGETAPASTKTKTTPGKESTSGGSGGAHGSRRPTSRPPRKRRANDPKNRPSPAKSASSGDKPVKPQKKSPGRVTPKNEPNSPRRRRGK